jgi:hypothetical protein
MWLPSLTDEIQQQCCLGGPRLAHDHHEVVEVLRQRVGYGFVALVAVELELG